MRKAGILMPVASLPSKYGVGDFGEEARYFIDLLHEAGVKIWQILPLNPLGYGNSPYQPYSSFAGDEIYISLKKLVNDGLLKQEPEPFRQDSERIDYEAVRAYKSKYLRQAFEAFRDRKSDGYEAFAAQEWVKLYGTFLTLKKANGMQCWNTWQQEHKTWIQNRQELPEEYLEHIEYEIFLQYIFYEQWMELKNYTNERGIEIMGDIPFYVGIDSLDVWSSQEAFLLDKEGQPLFIAGVPPDYFSADGQRWGNPIYDWDYLKEHNYKFWVDRIEYNSRLFDIIRIDHFRAFDTFWKIPADCPTAVEGEWIEAPGYEVLEQIIASIPGIHLAAEDLGDLREEVKQLRDHFELKGMKILQFSFDPNETNNDFPDKEHMIMYTGTHDNQTIRGWFESQPLKLRKEVEKQLCAQGCNQKSIAHKFVAYALNSIADTTIIPMSDVMNLSAKNRINTPGTVGSPNWEWRMKGFKAALDNLSCMGEWIKNSNR